MITVEREFERAGFMESDIVSGQQSAWVLLKKLGEGDAGEVYLVESLLEKQTAILKRPGRSAFASDVIRQTAQITNEAKILKALSAYFDLEPDLVVRVPRLIDQSKPGTAFSERLFIIIEQATGFDLSLLAKVSRMGTLSGAQFTTETPEARRFLQIISETGADRSFSDRIILSVLDALLETFERIHAHTFDLEGLTAEGVLWNDVKPEHLYWDPLRARLTIIDWGNGQFLERDGSTKDRRFTINEDYRQYIEAMSAFLQSAAPALHTRLNWPARVYPEISLPDLAHALRERILEALQQENARLSEARRREMELLRSDPAAHLSNHNPLIQLEELHREIISCGELPNFVGGLNFALNCAAWFADRGLLEEVREVCDWAAGLPGSNAEHLKLTSFLAKLASGTLDSARRETLCQAVVAALKQDWGSVLWDLCLMMRGLPEPDWWYDLVSAIRAQALGPETDDAHPLLIARRTLMTLQAMLDRAQDQTNGASEAPLQRLQALVRRLQEDILPAWVQAEPAPPYSGLDYLDIEEELEEIGAFLPDARYALDRSLDSARQMVSRVQADWERGDFTSASKGLRALLLLDHDRMRVLHAEQALLSAPGWIAKVHAGPQNGEHYRHFVTEREFEGRELRNQVGSAGWLDLILEGCRQLRKGAWPPDLFTTLPLLICEMPWLAKFERREKLPPAVTDGAALANAPLPFGNTPPLMGVVKGRLGPDQELELSTPLDAWIPEARGSSARVFQGRLKSQHGDFYPAAIKLMRMDKVDYSLPLFKEEVQVLFAMDGVPGAVPMLECGFLKLEGDSKYMTGSGDETPPTGSVIRIGPKSFQEFAYQIEGRIEEGLTPYIAIEPCEARANLLTLCDSSFTGGSFMPVADLLQIVIQICDLMAAAHQRNIVYRDHKILHYYWLEETRGVYAIDWNVARLHPEGLTDYEIQMDLVQFAARALHHILTGRTAPGALPLGPTRPEEIEQAAKSYQAQWTYDDQRLPEDLRAIIERSLAGEYHQAQTLRDELKQSFLQLPDI